MDRPMRIGIDFDNTIIDYTEAFALAAREMGLIDPSAPLPAGKTAIKAHILAHHPEGDIAWQRLQGQVYGAFIERAVPMPGFPEFLARYAGRGEFLVVSHKTVYGHFDPAQIDLRVAARDWMIRRGLLGDDKPIRRAFFEPTRGDKIARIVELGCDAFVDDLVEVLEDPGFPPDVRRLWLSLDGDSSRSGGADRNGADASSILRCRDWEAIGHALFGAGR